jgi:hypothetical protein
MKTKARALLLFAAAGTLLLLGLVFWRFTLEGIIVPSATVAWLLLRLFVLSIDQRVLWGGLIAAAVIVMLRALFRLSGRELPHPPASFVPVLDRVSPRRDAIQRHTGAAGRDDMVREELSWLLADLYSPRRVGEAKFQVRDALREHRIALPPSVHAFLFPPPAEAKIPFLKHPVARTRQRAAAMLSSFRTSIRARTGREASEYASSIDGVLSFMEQEMKNETSRE